MEKPFLNFTAQEVVRDFQPHLVPLKYPPGKDPGCVLATMRLYKRGRDKPMGKK